MKQKMGKFIEDTDDIGKLEEILATLLELRGKLEAGQEGRDSPDKLSTKPIKPIRPIKPRGECRPEYKYKRTISNE